MYANCVGCYYMEKNAICVRKDNMNMQDGMKGILLSLCNLWEALGKLIRFNREQHHNATRTTVSRRRRL